MFIPLLCILLILMYKKTLIYSFILDIILTSVRNYEITELFKEKSYIRRNIQSPCLVIYLPQQFLTSFTTAQHLFLPPPPGQTSTPSSVPDTPPLAPFIPRHSSFHPKGGQETNQSPPSLMIYLSLSFRQLLFRGIVSHKKKNMIFYRAS